MVNNFEQDHACSASGFILVAKNCKFHGGEI